MRIDRVACIGLNHRTAAVELRERFRGSLAEYRAFIERAREGADLTAVRELALLSTCNRVELYAHVDRDADEARALLTSLFANANGLDAASIAPLVYYRQGLDAVDHLCRVAAGLDSMILGEPQILGQVADAARRAKHEGTIGRVLSTVFRTAVRAGKRARTETEIGTNPASMSSIALATAREIVGPLDRKTVLVVGLGEMGMLTLKALRARGVQQIAIANRTRERADAVAAEWGFKTYSLRNLALALTETDVVISTTAAPTTVIRAPVVAAAMANRADRPLVLVDIAVPRDVDTDVTHVPGVHLFDADNLQAGLDEALDTRRRQVPLVEALIAGELRLLDNALNGQPLKPVITRLRHKAESIRQKELERTLRRLDHADAETLEQFRHFSRALVNKLLHEPTTRLKESAGRPEADEFARAVRTLFGLDEGAGVNK